MLIAHPTTEDHYRKYAELAELTGFTPTSHHPMGEYEYLLEKYLEDHILNNIQLKLWDNWGCWLQCGTKRLSIAELCCLGKHLVVYRVLGAIPIFYERKEKNVLTAHGFKELSKVSAINDEKSLGDSRKYGEWAEQTRSRFLRDKINMF